MSYEMSTEAHTWVKKATRLSATTLASRFQFGLDYHPVETRRSLTDVDAFGLGSHRTEEEESFPVAASLGRSERLPTNGALTSAGLMERYRRNVTIARKRLFS